MHDVFKGHSFDTPEGREKFYTSHESFPTSDAQANSINRVRWLQAADHAKPFLSMLDIGCHDGFVTRWLLNSFVFERLLGIDLCVDAIDKARLMARKNNPFWSRGEYRVQGFAGLPDEKFDGVVAFELIEHLVDEDARALVRCVHRRLKSGGRAFLSTPEITGLYGTSNTEDPSHINLFDSKRLKALIDEELETNVIVARAGDTLFAHWTRAG